MPRGLPPSNSSHPPPSRGARSRLRFVRAGRLRPLGREELELLRRTARLASIDNSCPACHHARAPARRMPWFSPAANRPVRSGMTSDLRIPQPECGHVSSLRELSAPLFMAAEWPRRLIKENAPYGLRMRGKTEEQMLTRLREYHRNVSQPVRCRYETCAVVGSSGNLRGKQYGQLIDAHEAVFRVNAAPVHRHEEAVGARTTWRFMNSEKPFFMASLGVPELQVVICHMGWIGSCQRQAFGGAYMETIAYVNPIFYGQLWSMLGRPVGKQTPSTGLLAIALALGVCGKVNIFGFGRRSEDSACRHYWECPKWGEYHDPGHPFHDWIAEERLRDSWLQASIIYNGSSYGEGSRGAAAFVASTQPRSKSNQ